jgi:hypothetical protein
VWLKHAPVPRLARDWLLLGSVMHVCFVTLPKSECDGSYAIDTDKTDPGHQVKASCAPYAAAWQLCALPAYIVIIIIIMLPNQAIASTRT